MSIENYDAFDKRNFKLEDLHIEDRYTLDDHERRIAALEAVIAALAADFAEAFAKEALK